MSEFYFNKGVKAGWSGREPDPPKPEPLWDACIGASRADVKEWSGDYMKGYSAGSQQRLADKSKDKDG